MPHLIDYIEQYNYLRVDFTGKITGNELREMAFTVCDRMKEYKVARVLHRLRRESDISVIDYQVLMAEMASDLPRLNALRPEKYKSAWLIMSSNSMGMAKLWREIAAVSVNLEIFEEEESALAWLLAN